MAMETQDIIKRSATNPITPAPRARDYKAEVAKLIDVSSCVGCKACQVACSEWNDIRDDVGHCVGVYDNPADLSAKSWTVMRFSETEQNGKLEWLIRKDGCMHCAEPGCLKACPSVWGGDRLCMDGSSPRKQREALRDKAWGRTSRICTAGRKMRFFYDLCDEFCTILDC